MHKNIYRFDGTTIAKAQVYKTAEEGGEMKPWWLNYDKEKL